MKLNTSLKLKTNIVSPVPLLDVVLLLVMFFVLAVNFIGSSGLVLELPATVTASVYAGDIVKISIISDDVYLDKKEVTVAELKDELMNLKAENEDSLIVINADDGVAHARIVELIDLARSSGFNRLAIATERNRD